MAKFLRWFVKWADGIFEDNSVITEAVSGLEHARALRTILDHAGLGPPFDWANVEVRGITRIRLSGPLSANGGAPEGTMPMTFPVVGWAFEAPDELLVTEALADCMRLTMPLLLGAAFVGGTVVEDERDESPRAASLYSPRLQGGVVKNFYVRVRPPIDR